MRCVAIEANWPGYASVKKAILFSFLKVRPTTDILEISYENGRLTIDQFGVAALWAETPEWITEMSTDARFMGIRGNLCRNPQLQLTTEM